jgi:hypothetical protein
MPGRRWPVVLVSLSRQLKLASIDQDGTKCAVSHEADLDICRRAEAYLVLVGGQGSRREPEGDVRRPLNCDRRRRSKADLSGGTACKARGRFLDDIFFSLFGIACTPLQRAYLKLMDAQMVGMSVTTKTDSACPEPGGVIGSKTTTAATAHHDTIT